MDVEVSTEPTRRYLSLATIVKKYDTTKITVYRLIADGLFPPAVKLGAGNRWPEDEVEQWIKQGRAAR